MFFCGLTDYAVCRTVFFLILVHAYCSYLTDLYEYFAGYFFGDIIAWAILDYLILFHP